MLGGKIGFIALFDAAVPHMQPRDLFKRLLALRELTPSALARTLRDSGRVSVNLQSHLSKWLRDPAVQPSTRTMRPVADFLEVSLDAMYSARVATQEARRLGLLPGVGRVSDGPAPGGSGVLMRRPKPPAAWPFSVTLIRRIDKLSPEERDELEADVLHAVRRIEQRAARRRNRRC